MPDKLILYLQLVHYHTNKAFEERGGHVIKSACGKVPSPSAAVF